MEKKTKVWVLTREHNDYDQHGEYFVAAFAAKPTHKALAATLSKQGLGHGTDLMAAIAFLEHLLAGGGRQQHEDEWYNLSAVECEDHA